VPRNSLNCFVKSFSIPSAFTPQLKHEERVKNYDLFKANGSSLLVATDLFGRDIDIEPVNLVINYGVILDIKIPNRKRYFSPPSR
jgi:ATP-dependent RNA helicase UAP56/SUB2